MTEPRGNFRSDNVGGVAPEILEALVRANRGTAASYGADEHSAALDALASEVFGRAVKVFPVATGTAANALSVAALTPPWGAVYCHETAHVHTAEAGAAEFFSGGAKVVPLAGPGFRMEPDALAAALEHAGIGQSHRPQPAVLSLTQPTDFGTTYRPGEVRALADIAAAHGLKVHMDGARLANALSFLGCAPAETTWRAGVDVLSLGATKNGAMFADAVVFFDLGLADAFRYRLRRSGQVWSKMRYAAAQLEAYLRDGLWLRLAARANGFAARLGERLATLPGARLVAPVEANEIFLELPVEVIAALRAEGFLFADRGTRVIRLVCRWDTEEGEIERLAEAVARHLEGLGA